MLFFLSLLFLIRSERRSLTTTPNYIEVPYDIKFSEFGVTVADVEPFEDELAAAWDAALGDGDDDVTIIGFDTDGSSNVEVTYRMLDTNQLSLFDPDFPTRLEYEWANTAGLNAVLGLTAYPSKVPSQSPSEFSCPALRLFAGVCDYPAGLDVLFVIDTDSTGGTTSAADDLANLITFSKEILNDNVRDDADFGLITFADTSEVILDTYDNTDRTDWEAALDSMTQSTQFGTSEVGMKAGLDYLNALDNNHEQMLFLFYDSSSHVDLCDFVDQVGDIHVYVLVIEFLPVQQTCWPPSTYFQFINYQLLGAEALGIRAELNEAACGSSSVPFTTDFYESGEFGGRYQWETLDGVSLSFDAPSWVVDGGGGEKMTSTTGDGQAPAYFEEWSYLESTFDTTASTYDVYAKCYSEIPTLVPSIAPSEAPSNVTLFLLRFQEETPKFTNFFFQLSKIFVFIALKTWGQFCAINTQ